MIVTSLNSCGNTSVENSISPLKESGRIDSVVLTSVSPVILTSTCDSTVCDTVE